jgi:hypothetical protein
MTGGKVLRRHLYFQRVGFSFAPIGQATVRRPLIDRHLAGGGGAEVIAARHISLEIHDASAENHLVCPVVPADVACDDAA